jgi:flap endonuclease-1
MEAETTCSDLCKRGIVDAVLSEDTDVLAYSAPIFLTKIDTNLDTCVRLKHSQILEFLEMTELEFLDLCIMCGCDYNKNIPKIGPQNAYKYLQKYKSIDEIGKNTVLDISVLNHIRTRELFTKYQEIDIISIPFCGIPDFEKLTSFIKDNNININIETLKKNFTHNNLIIYEE